MRTLVRSTPLYYHLITMWWRRAILLAKLSLFFLLFILLAAPEWPAFQAERHILNTIVGLEEFDFLQWMVGALQTKGEAEAAAGYVYLPAEQRKETVLRYLELVRATQELQAQINLLYVDAEVADPAAVAAPLANELAHRRQELETLQPLAEGIVQEQVAAVLAEEGFGRFGALWPPVRMHMTPLPLVLIVSPRNEIRQIYNVPLVHGLTTPQMETLEEAVRERLDHSALVVPIGGLGFYPSMIVETSNVNFLADVVAHEWAHHWLTFHPLGVRYAADPALRTINETVASIVGTEIGARVIERFYPEFVPPPPAAGAESRSSEEGPPFEFRAEMAETRVTVDELLEAGKIEAAEAYMEERRQLFVRNGYPIRKINQAYFAFYGAYADTEGATGSDPVGPAVRALRENSPSLYAFAREVARVTSFEALQERVARTAAAPPLP